MSGQYFITSQQSVTLKFECITPSMEYSHQRFYLPNQIFFFINCRKLIQKKRPKNILNAFRTCWWGLLPMIQSPMFLWNPGDRNKPWKMMPHTRFKKWWWNYCSKFKNELVKYNTSWLIYPPTYKRKLWNWQKVAFID